MSAALTPEQQEAVARRDGPLFVRAGAGSGKTRVLVERFLAAVREDQVPVDRILAITFTEKAAAELRTRVRERLLATGDREAARQAEAAAISTVHGFCARLLRANALAAGLDPEFRVLDETDAARLTLDAFDAALGQFLEEAAGNDQLDLAARYLPDRLRAMVTTVYRQRRSLGESDPRLPPVAVPSPAGERERLEEAIAKATAELGAHEGGRSVEAARSTLERCGRMLGVLSGIPSGAQAGTAEPDELAKLAVKRGNARVLNTPAFEELTEAHSAYLAFCEAGRAAADHALLARLLEIFGGRYAAAKEALSALDFEDLELRARDLLRDDPALCAAVRDRYSEVMVDEFQDTNQLQSDIVDLVGAGNLFAVGDDRQSIYGFRHADVALFRRRGEQAAEAGRAAGLVTNFRSRPEILAALNAAFGPLWDGYEPLLPAPGADATPPRVEPSVELLLVDRWKARWEETLGAEAFGTGAGEAIWRGAEARLLAQRIGELAGPGRPFEYGDVAILLRAATDIALYERALVERGIPAYSHGGRGFSEAQQVGDLRAYLAAVANPLDELALVNLLASPLAGISLGAIASVRLRARALRRNMWWALEQAFRPGGDGSPHPEQGTGLADALGADDRERLAAFVERFARERADAARLSLETVIDRAVTDSGYDRIVLAMAGGDRRLANVRKLMRLARRFEAEHGRDLRRFIDHLDEREELRAHEGEAPVEGESRSPAVRLMTIHAAKGLEFPVVCVADLGRPTRGGDDAGLQVADDGRVGLRLASMSGERSSALEWERLKEEQTARAEEEERRIFYVAMTRAQEHLVLSGATDLERWPEPRPLREPIDWIWRAVAPGAKDLAESAYEGVDVRETDWGRVSVRCTVLSPGTVDDVLPAGARRPAAERAEEGDIATLPPRPELEPVPPARPLPVGRLSYSSLESYRRCGYRFYLERVAGLGRREEPPIAPAAPEANGDGQLVLALDDAAAPTPAATPSGAQADGVTPLLRGSIVHELLERLDMRAPAVPDADTIATRLGAHGAPAEPAELDRIAGLIRGFATSPLRERIAAAERVRVELPFAFALDTGTPPPVLVNGIVDVHAEGDDGVLIVDYKTDPLHGGDPAAAVERGYTTQRLVYALAALRSGARRVEVAYCFLEAPDAPVSATFEPGDAGELERRLVDLAAGVLGGEFAATDTPHRELCWTCPGRASLCVHGPERTLSEPPTPSLRSDT